MHACMERVHVRTLLRLASATAVPSRVGAGAGAAPRRLPQPLRVRVRWRVPSRWLCRHVVERATCSAAHLVRSSCHRSTRSTDGRLSRGLGSTAWRLRLACTPAQLTMACPVARCLVQAQPKMRLLEYRCMRFFYVDSMGTFVPVPGCPKVRLSSLHAQTTPAGRCMAGCAMGRMSGQSEAWRQHVGAQPSQFRQRGYAHPRGSICAACMHADVDVDVQGFNEALQRVAITLAGSSVLVADSEFDLHERQLR